MVCILLVLFLCGSNAYSQNLEHEEVIEGCNEVIQNIYNDIWIIKDGYSQLNDFGMQNLYNETRELPPHYRKIKNIRIENKEERATRKTLFMDDRLNAYIQDEIYICFSDAKKVLGIGSDPVLGIYMKPFRLYLLFFSTSRNDYLKKAIINILTRNARAAIM